MCEWHRSIQSVVLEIDKPLAAIPCFRAAHRVLQLAIFLKDTKTAACASQQKENIAICNLLYYNNHV